MDPYPAHPQLTIRKRYREVQAKTIKSIIVQPPTTASNPQQNWSKSLWPSPLLSGPR